MADNLSSRICLRGSRSSNESNSQKKYGAGCVNLFFTHLVDWNRKLTSKGFLRAAAAMHQQETSKKNRRKKQRSSKTIHNDEKALPMAKLLMIADENRRSHLSTRIGDVENSSSNNSSPGVNAVARLMGLEQMPSSPNPVPTEETVEAKQVSLQELLHLDHEEPQMLQEFLKSASNKHTHFPEASMQKISPSQQEALFSLLMQEVVHKKEDASPIRQSGSRKSKKNKANSKCRNGAFAAPVASSGCGSGFGKNMFLEAAARILEPRSNHLKGPPLVPSTAPLDKQDFDTTGCNLPVKKRATISAPCSPVSRHHLNRDVSCCSSSTTGTSSVMELFYDDLMEQAREGDDYDYFHAMSEPCSPYTDKSPASWCSSTSRTTSTARQPHPHKRVPLNDLGEQDYVSFRDFLTRSSSSASSCPSTPPPSCTQRASPCDDDHHKFTMVHNPLFDHGATFEDVGSSSTTFETASDCDDDDTDQGLEDILKSILSDANKEQTRITWSPQESYMFSKELSEECKSTLDDSIEATSESNCGEGQPSPVSVLDNSPFDDDVHGKPSSRKRLDFDELHLSPVLESPTQSSRCDTDVSFKTSSEVHEVLDYVNMVLRECGVEHRREALLLLLEPCIMDDELFERLEDRMRVEELIKHLEAYNKGNNDMNKNTLKTHCKSYYECRAQRRLVFDFTNECLMSVLEEVCNETFLVETSNNHKSLFLSSGRDVVEEVELRVAQWSRQRFDNIDQVVERDIGKEWGTRQNSVLITLVRLCEEDIFQGLVDDIANDLLA